jgi:hypothetical protein
MEDFEIEGRRYKSSKMDARTALHVLRRLAPAFKDMETLRGVIDAADTGKKEVGPADFLAAATPLVQTLSDMPDDKLDYVINACMGLVSREEGVGWPRIWNKQTQRPQYDDITLLLMLQIVAAVIMGTFADFFSSPLSSSLARQGTSTSNP